MSEQWKTRALDGLVLVALLALTLLVRWSTLQRIETGGDPLDNWFFVKQWHYNKECFAGYLNHHNARVGIHWLTWVCQKLFGTQPTVYYLPPLIASHCCTALVYWIGRRAYSRPVGVVAALLLLEFNPFIFASSQLRPGVFEAAYLLATAAFVTEHFCAAVGRKCSWQLVAAGCCAFGAYLVKVPTLFASVGVGLSLLLWGGGWRAVLFYSAPMVLGLCMETVLYNVFTEYPHRIGVIMSAHARNPPSPRNFWYLFKRFSSANDSWRLLYYFFFAAGLRTLLAKAFGVRKFLVLMAGAYLFLITFGVRSLNPIGLWIAMRDRYLTAVAPLAMVVNASLLVEAARRFGEWVVSCGSTMHKGGNTRWLHHAVTVAALVLWAGGVGWKAWPSPTKRAAHALSETRRVFEVVTDAYRRRLPIIARVTRNATQRRPWKQVRALHWAAKGFVADDVLLDENGHLQPFSYRTSVAPLNSKHSYIPTAAGPAERVNMLRKNRKDCTLYVALKRRSAKISNPGWAMPADCPTH